MDTNRTYIIMIVIHIISFSFRTEDEVVKRLASQFSAESQTRDDETHMYVCLHVCVCVSIIN